MDLGSQRSAVWEPQYAVFEQDTGANLGSQVQQSLNMRYIDNSSVQKKLMRKLLDRAENYPMSIELRYWEVNREVGGGRGSDQRWSAECEV